MNGPIAEPFDVAVFLASTGLGRKTFRLGLGETFFAQGAPATSVFYLQTGNAKLSVISKRGKEAVIRLLKGGDFTGEESLADVAGVHTATATTVTACTVLGVDRTAMIHLLNNENAFADTFLKFLLLRGMRTQEDLVDQLFNSSEHRLARTLLLMADFGEAGEPRALLPPITQEALAEMIGTTRSRVSQFMNRFRRLGYIEYNGRIHVNRSLLNAVLHDQLPEQNSSRPITVDPRHHPSERITQKPSVSKGDLSRSTT